MKKRRPARYELADELLKELGGIDHFVRARRLRMKPVGWTAIADEIERLTDGRVAVSGSALSKWFVGADAAQEESQSLLDRRVS